MLSQTEKIKKVSQNHTQFGRRLLKELAKEKLVVLHSGGSCSNFYTSLLHLVHTASYSVYISYVFLYNLYKQLVKITNKFRGRFKVDTPIIICVPSKNILLTTRKTGSVFLLASYY